MINDNIKYFLDEDSKKVLIITNDTSLNIDRYVSVFDEVNVLYIGSDIVSNQTVRAYSGLNKPVYIYDDVTIKSAELSIDSIIVESGINFIKTLKLIALLKRVKSINKKISLLLIGFNYLGYNSFFKKSDKSRSLLIINKLLFSVLGFKFKNEYVSRHNVRFGINGFVDMLSLNGCGSTSNVSGSLFLKIKERLISSKLLMYFWPYYIQTFSTTDKDDYLTTVVYQALDSICHDKSCTNDSIIDRYIMGNAYVDLIMVSVPGEDVSRYVLRIPNDDKGKKLCKRNHDFIHNNVDQLISRYIPGVSQCLDLGNINIYIEERLDGYELITYENKNEYIVNQAVDIINNYQYRNKGKYKNNEISEIVDLIFDFSFVDLGVDIISNINYLKEYIKESLRKRQQYSVPNHGDYKIGNLLFDKKQRIQGIIDWDHYNDKGLLLYDHLTMIMQILRGRHKSVNESQCYVNYILPWKIDDYLDVLIKKSMALYDVNDSEFLSYRILYWIYNIKSRYLIRFTDKEWINNFLAIPLNNVINTLPMNADNRSSNKYR